VRAGLGRLAVGRTDVDRAVVLDRELRAGVVLDLVDDLALGPMTSPILSTGILIVMIRGA
jgi:hypothetical protein